MINEALLEIDHLGVTLPVDGRPRPILRDVSLRLNAHDALAIVGESGSGKSMTARAIMRLLPEGATTSGVVRFQGHDVATLSGPSLREYHTRGIGVVFQDPRAHINPVRTIGDYLTEVLTTNLGLSQASANARVLDLLAQVGIPNAQRRLRQYPHQLSGGLLQRVMIAAALAPEPQLLIADEPTTALDVTTQADVVAVLNEQRQERQMALIFITHDLDLAAAICDRTAVMYAGTVVEEQRSTELHEHPLHPYTAALLNSRPRLEGVDTLTPIQGQPLPAWEAPEGCAFAGRCEFANDLCRASRPDLVGPPERLSACLRTVELCETLTLAVSEA